MSVTGPGSITALNLTAQTNMFSQLTTLSQELGTGQAAQTFSGLDSQAGVAVELGAQVSAINGYSATATNVSTTLSVAQSVLGQLSQAGAAVAQSIAQQGTFTLDGNGQTTTQQAAAGYLESDPRPAQHSGRRQLHVFRQRREPARRCLDQRHSQRQWRPGRA